MEDAAALIHLRDVRLRRNGLDILSGIDWRMGRGEHWAVVGANGSGKTTLLQIAAGTLFPTAGEATVLGERFGKTDLFALRRRIGWISSALLARLPGHETALDVAVSGLKATFGLVYDCSPRDRETAAEHLRRMGLAERLDTPFGLLSQGERQKVLFARSLMTDPGILILDEACSGLDIPARESFLRAVGDIMAAGRTGTVMATHHIEEIPPDATHALALKGGKILASGPVEETISSAVLSETFGLRIAVERRNRRFWAIIG